MWTSLEVATADPRASTLIAKLHSCWNKEDGNSATTSPELSSSSTVASSSTTPRKSYVATDDGIRRMTLLASGSTNLNVAGFIGNPHIKTTVAFPSSFGTYIIYLLPTRASQLARRLRSCRNFAEAHLGADESFLYPLHCTITGFFSVVSPRVTEHDCSYEHIRKSEIIRDTLKSLFTQYEDYLPGSEGLLLGSSDCEEMSRSRVLITSECSLIIPLKIPQSIETVVKRFKEDLPAVLSKNQHLPELDIIQPGNIESKGIRLKLRHHMTLLSNKGRGKTLQAQPAVRMAKLFDNAICPNASFTDQTEDHIHWDLALEEMVVRGSLEDGRPHFLRPVCRIPNVAVTSLSTSRQY